MNHFSLASALACAIFTAQVFAASPTIKVDFDMSGRQSAEVTEPNFTRWMVSGVSSKDTTISGVKINIAKGSVGTNLRSTYYKIAVQSPNYARLVGDGVKVDGGDNGGEISLTFSNLQNGENSILLYLNHPDDYTTNKPSDIDVYVNGVKQASVAPTVRALANDKAAFAYMTFKVTNGTVDIALKPRGNNTIKNVILNGFELNVANVAAQAKSPVPSDLNMHAAHNHGAMTLSWNAANGAKKHQIYLGLDSLAVVNANTKSADYKGEQTSTSYQVSNLTPLQSYFWRVDEVDGNGIITKGNVWKFQPGRLAFDDAEGYGRMAVGGRGGKVVYVTNLNDDGAGSLREACTADIGPRTIVFKVAGMIQLKSRLVCNHDFTTIAGQTAPGKGITIKSAPIGFTGHDMIVRFMRVRLGYGTTYDGMGLTGGDNSILDHASISWTIDEAFSSRGGKNLTLQRTLISEALNIADHQNYPKGTGHGYAATIGGDVGSFHHNLLAHNEGRNWSMGGGLDGNGYYAGRLDIFNNVVYNWEGRVTDGGAHEVNFVGNYYKAGAASRVLDYVLKADLEGTGKGSQAYYFHNNILQLKDGKFKCDGTKDDCGRTYTLSNGQKLDWTIWNAKPFFESYAKIQSATAAYKDVLSDVGQRMPVFDDHDTRIIKEVKNGTYTYTGSVGKMPGIPDRETDVGGWENYPSVSWADDYDSDLDGLPDWWEKMYGTNPKSAKGDFSDANKDRLNDGWTELERYLEWMARAHYTFENGETQPIDLSQFTKGYDNGTYQLSNIPSGVNAKVNGSKMTVSLSENFAGIGYITFTLTDKSGDTFTRKIGVTQAKAISELPKSSSSITPVSSSSIEKSSSSISSSSSAEISSSSIKPESSSSIRSGNIYQAEDGKMTNATFADKNAGFNGSGYVNFAGEGNSIVEIPVNVKEAGEYNVIFTYAIGKSESRRLKISAGENSSIAECESTGAWNVWKTQSVSLKLNAGENKIQIETVDGDGPNLDQIEIQAAKSTAIQTLQTNAFHYSVAKGIVYLNGIPQNAKISVFDLSGKNLMSQKNVVTQNGSALVNLQNFGNGIYLIHISGKTASGNFAKNLKIKK